MGIERGDNVTAEERAGEGRLNGVGFGAKRLKVRVDNAQQHKAHRGHAVFTPKWTMACSNQSSLKTRGASQ